MGAGADPPTRWFPGFWSRRRSWGCALEEIFRARSSQRRRKESEFCILGDQPSEDPPRRWRPGFWNGRIYFFGKTGMLKLMRILACPESSATKTCEWMWMMKWMWRNKYLVWVRGDPAERRRDSWRGELRASATWTWTKTSWLRSRSAIYIHVKWKDAMNTQSLTWETYSSKWVKAKNHNF